MRKNGGKFASKRAAKRGARSLCGASLTLSLRVPSWVGSAPVVVLNGNQLDNPEIQNGWLNIAKKWSNDVLQIFFPSKVIMESLPDMPELAAAVDGPIVLAGLTDSDCGLAGNFDKPDEFFFPQLEHTYGTFPWKQNCYVTRNQPKDIMFKPLYEITDEIYTVYFTKK